VSCPHAQASTPSGCHQLLGLLCVSSDTRGERGAATQVVSDFNTTFEGPDSIGRVLSAQGKPALVYTYKMRFQRSA
jgi:hypothetical protein